MQASDLALTDTLRPRTATGYGQDGEPTPHWELSGGYAPAGAVNSSAADMLRYLRANLGQVGSEALQSAMAMTHTPRESMTGNLRIGLGWISMPAGTGHWHNGGTYGFHTFAGFNPDSDRAVLLWANSFGVTLSVFLEDDQLMAQLAGQQAFPSRCFQKRKTASSSASSMPRSGSPATMRAR